MVRRELIAIGLSFILVAALAGVISVSAYAITSFIETPTDSKEIETIISVDPVIAA